MPGEELEALTNSLQNSTQQALLQDLEHSLTVSKIVSGILFGMIGLWMFRRGKHNSDIRILAIGVALMIYPYVTDGPLLDWGVGFALCGLAYYLWNR